MSTNGDLINLLIEQQRQSGLNDGDFAKLLNTDRSLWNRIKSRAREPSKDFLGEVLKKFPTLQYAIIRWLVER